MTTLSCSALDFIWMEMIPLFGIKGNHWSDRKWMRDYGSVNNLLRRWFRSPSPRRVFSCLLHHNMHWVTATHSLTSKKFGNNIFFFISGNCLESKEHKTIIINWLKKPSTNTKNQSEHTHWLTLHENEWEQITSAMNNNIKKNKKYCQKRMS